VDKNIIATAAIITNIINIINRRIKVIIGRIAG